MKMYFCRECIIPIDVVLNDIWYSFGTDFDDFPTLLIHIFLLSCCNVLTLGTHNMQIRMVDS